MDAGRIPPRAWTESFVLREWKTAVVTTPKTGCTSLKWALAGVAGEPLDGVRASLSQEVTRSMAIHDRSVWRRTPALPDLPAAELAGIRADAGWLVLSVVRHPTTRLWSAWQSKLLLREPYWLATYGDREWFPRVPARRSEVLEDFAAFVAALEADPELLAADDHWRPQVDVIAVDDVPYTHIGRLESLAATYAVLEAHLRAQGWSGELARVRENDSPLPFEPDRLPAGTLAAVERLYARDFDRFGYPPAPPPAHRRRAGDHDPAVAEVARLVARSERLADLQREAQRLHAELEEHREVLGRALTGLAADVDRFFKQLFDDGAPGD